MKKFLKDMLKKNSKNAYTAMEFYTPKKPQTLK